MDNHHGMGLSFRSNVMESIKSKEFDTAYQVGYYEGYHIGQENDYFAYDAEREPQMHIKYKHGFADGLQMKLKEGLTDDN